MPFQRRAARMSNSYPKSPRAWWDLEIWILALIGATAWFLCTPKFAVTCQPLAGEPVEVIKESVTSYFPLEFRWAAVKTTSSSCFQMFFFSAQDCWRLPLWVISHSDSQRASRRKKHLNDGRLSVPRERCKVYISLQALKTRIRALTNEEAALTGCEFLPYLINQRFQSGVYWICRIDWLLQPASSASEHLSVCVFVNQN